MSLTVSSGVIEIFRGDVSASKEYFDFLFSFNAYNYLIAHVQIPPNSAPQEVDLSYMTNNGEVPALVAIKSNVELTVQVFDLSVEELIIKDLLCIANSDGMDPVTPMRFYFTNDQSVIAIVDILIAVLAPASSASPGFYS